MSVQTTADEHLSAAREAVREAIKNLAKIVVEEVWGHDEYTRDFKEDLRQAQDELIGVRERLGAP